MSIFVLAEIIINPEHKILTYDFMSAVVQKSRQEQGCIQYDLFTIDDDFLIFEEWADENALERHKDTSHFKSLVEAIEEDNAILSVRLIDKIEM